MKHVDYEQAIALAMKTADDLDAGRVVEPWEASGSLRFLAHELRFWQREFIEERKAASC